MKYEIIKGKDDVYVLVISNIVVLVSRNIESITKEIQSDCANRQIKPTRAYEPVVFDVELPNTEEIPTKEDIKPQPRPIGRLFTL